MAEVIPFFKMSGSGNDFIVIDNRSGLVSVPDLSEWVRKICKRAMSVGADGLILIEDDPAPDVDFTWRFFNADGSVAEMCGNGARCAARFARINGIAGTDMRFRTLAGIIAATVGDNGVALEMTPPTDLVTGFSVAVSEERLTVSSINTGVPHLVVPVEDLEAADVQGMGRSLRFHPDFAPAGTNVNFVQATEDGSIAIRTYERGVEDETLACGTGAVASALVAAVTGASPSPVSVTTRSGSTLSIHFNRTATGFENVRLEGDARIVYRGDLDREAWTYVG